MSAAVRIRAFREGDLEILPHIEREAGELFATVGMHAVADDDPPSPADFRGHLASGRGWVAVDDGDRPVGYLVVDVVDGHAHIEQVSVLPAWGRRGIGRQLIEHAVCWAVGSGHRAVTLTTFTTVPWNGPYYERLGFRYLTSAEVGSQLAAIRAAEAARGLDAWPRACMSKNV